jgi:anti-sigma-K factor RskA
MTEDDDIDGLAGEYVLGSLDPAERADVNSRRRTDISLAAAIEAWQRRISPLSESASGISPPPELFGSILSRISDTPIDFIGSCREVGQPTGPTQVIALPRHRKSSQRIIAVGVSALAACLALAIGWFIHTQLRTAPKHVTGMDCSRLYKEFWGKLENDRYARIPAEQLAGVARMALRAYDACQAGDKLDANALFRRLDLIRF